MNRAVQSLSQNRVATVVFWLVVMPALCGALMAGVTIVFMMVGSLFVRLPGKVFVFVASCFFVVGCIGGLRLAWPRFRNHWALLQQ